MKIWIAVILVILFGAAAWYYIEVYQPGREAVPAAISVAKEEPAPVDARPEPEGTAEDSGYEPYQLQQPVEIDTAGNLPALAQSDPVINETIARMVGESAAIRSFVPDAVVSRFVATVDALDSAQVPPIVLPVEPLGGEFEATADESPQFEQRTLEGDLIPQYVLDPANYRRYAGYVEMMEALDIDELVANYKELYPLIQEAWIELGYGDGDFNARLLEVIEQLIETPQPLQPVRLIKPEGVYHFRDPQLEALSAGQKTLIRMGPDNAARVQAWLRELRAAIELFEPKASRRPRMGE